ncbi:MAG: DUF72 domain-containing protein [Acidobacteriota bacterium]
MSNLSLFAAEPSPLAAKLARLAARGILIGGSSWKYEGWLGQIYTPERYFTRGKFSAKKFEDTCLAEYAETFPVVCGDFSFYQFPSTAFWAKLFASAPDSLRFAFKVPEEITVKAFPAHPRYGHRAGLNNPNFLDFALFEQMFLAPLQPYAGRTVALIFEFGQMSRKTMPDVEAFLEKLVPFLEKLPAGPHYSVELRNAEFLTPAYFAALREHGVAHVFNAWTRMPELPAQTALPDAHTARFTVVRALLRQGRSYEDAVKTFSPYDRLQDPNPAARDALRALINRSLRLGQPASIFVNNRFEGNAPATIEALVEEIDL